MKWIVTSTPHPNCTSVIGKHNFPGVAPKLLTVEEFPFEFRLLDGDNNLDLEGRCGDLDNADQEQAFAPLDAFTGSWGCVTMQYRKVGETRWQTL